MLSKEKQKLDADKIYYELIETLKIIDKKRQEGWLLVYNEGGIIFEEPLVFKTPLIDNCIAFRIDYKKYTYFLKYDSCECFQKKNFLLECEEAKRHLFTKYSMIEPKNKHEIKSIVKIGID